MSDLNTPSTKPARRGNGSRYLFMALLGLVIGVVASVMAMRAIEQRRDPYPEAVMHVMRAHMQALKGNVTQNRCAATDVIPHLQALRTMANDIEPAFKDMQGDDKFAGYASELRAAVDTSLLTPPLNCPGVQAAAAKIGQACESCHRYVHD
jgi:cytochrome c556